MRSRPQRVKAIFHPLDLLAGCVRRNVVNGKVGEVVCFIGQFQRTI